VVPAEPRGAHKPKAQSTGKSGKGRHESRGRILAQQAADARAAERDRERRKRKALELAKQDAIAIALRNDIDELERQLRYAMSRNQTKKAAGIQDQLHAARSSLDDRLHKLSDDPVEGELWELEAPEAMARRTRRGKARVSQADVDAARAAAVHGEGRGGSGAGTSDTHTAPARYRQIRQGVERRAEQKRQARARKAQVAATADPRVTALEEQVAELERLHRAALGRDAGRAAQLSEDLRSARTTLKQLKAQLAGQTNESELWELFV
jgi:hypothetical protein